MEKWNKTSRILIKTLFFNNNTRSNISNPHSKWLFKNLKSIFPKLLRVQSIKNNYRQITYIRIVGLPLNHSIILLHPIPWANSSDQKEHKKKLTVSKATVRVKADKIKVMLNQGQRMGATQVSSATKLK